MIRKHTLTNTFHSIYVAIALLLVIASCKKKEGPDPVDDLKPIEVTLDAFVATLVSNPPTQADLSNRVKSYLLAQPKAFFGSTVALLDSAGKAYYSPYWYRSGNTVVVKDLADTSYHIDEQDWLRLPIDGGKAIWTEPYFDAGGGEIWMRTRSVPVYISGKIIAVATTDLEVENP